VIPGKSSLLNVVTDTPHLAKALAAGESCTSVPTYYMHRLPWQSSAFAAEIRYYPVEECRQLPEELLGQYNFYTFEKDEDWTNDQRNEYSQLADTAIQTFRTLFCGSTEFRSQAAAENVLSYSYSNDRKQGLLDTMVVSCKEAFASHPEENGAAFTRFAANTASELRSCTDPLTAPYHSRDTHSLWPLVESVQIGVPSSRVLKYATMVDLPGIISCPDDLLFQR
jgi:hypothetical protein